MTRESKKAYYENYFTKHASNSKKVWQGINDLLHKNRKGTNNEIYLNENGQIITDQKIVANKFNTFYTNIAQKLVDKIENSNNEFQDYLKNPNEHSIFLNETEPGEIYNLIMKLDVKKASDIYHISSKLIKTAATPLSEILALLFNRSFELGIFPTKLKLAKVLPIYKADSKMDTSNYRPISLLSIISKIFEKVMYARIISFLNSENILYPHQYGFQKNKSTEQAIISIQSKIVDAFERKENPCCIFLDFAKAFDTVNHSILVNKLNHYGIRGKALEWLYSYLNEREQCVPIGNTKSNIEKITCGVPQGSVLGPLLFLLYINDIPNSSSVLKFHLFADDTSIFFSHKDIKKLQDVLNQELNNVSEWLKANKLSLNVKKSNVLLFRAKNASKEKLINIMINNEPLEEKHIQNI